MNYRSAHCIQSLTLYSPIPCRLDSLTLTITRWFTNGMYIQLKNRLQIHIIKYILSRKLNKKISSIMKRIRTAQYLTDYEIREYMFAREAPSHEELLIKCIKGEKVNYSDLVLVYSILKFGTKFLELYYDYYYNRRLPSHSNHKNREYIIEKNYYIPDNQIIYSIQMSTNIEPFTLVSPKKNKEKKNFPPLKKVWYNQRK